MTPSSVTTQHVTNASGTIAIASTSTSIGAQTIASKAPAGAEQLLHTADMVITTADMVGMFSASILFASFLWNIYSSKKKREIDERYYSLRKAEHELAMAKFKQGNQ